MRLLLRSFLFTLLAITFSSMNVFSQSATIVTDQPDYAPGSTVIISGTGFQPGETVTLQVLHDPTGGDDATSPAHQPWTVVADANGNVSSTWLVPADEDELGATLKLTAVGGSSRVTAEVTFTDAGTKTITAIISSENPSTYGDVVTFTVTVSRKSGQGGNPDNGSITIKDGPLIINSGMLNGGNTYQFSTSTLTAGTHNITAEYGGSSSGSNFETSTSDLLSQIVNKAASVTTVTINGGSFTYSGSAITPASVTVTGAGGLSLTPTADYANNINAGTATASYTYPGDANHDGSSDSKTFEIAKANPIISVTPYSVTYDGDPHSASGSATGVKGEALSGLDLSSTNHTNAGSYTTDAWSFTDVTGNYNNDNGTVDDEIAKANASISVTPYNVTYNGDSHSASGSATGVKGEALTGLDLSATNHTNAGSYATDAWSFTDVTGNYNNDNGTVDDEIAKRPITITPNPNQFKYCGTPDPTFNFTGSEDLLPGNSYSGKLSRDGGENSGVGTYSYT